MASNDTPTRRTARWIAPLVAILALVAGMQGAGADPFASPSGEGGWIDPVIPGDTDGELPNGISFRVMPASTLLPLSYTLARAGSTVEMALRIDYPTARRPQLWVDLGQDEDRFVNVVDRKRHVAGATTVYFDLDVGPGASVGAHYIQARVSTVRGNYAGTLTYMVYVHRQASQLPASINAPSEMIHVSYLRRGDSERTEQWLEGEANLSFAADGSARIEVLGDSLRMIIEVVDGVAHVDFVAYGSFFALSSWLNSYDMGGAIQHPLGYLQGRVDAGDLFLPEAGRYFLDFEVTFDLSLDFPPVRVFDDGPIRVDDGTAGPVIDERPVREDHRRPIRDPGLGR